MIAMKRLVVTVPLLTLCASVAGASFHLMQVEQAIGGVCGDTSAQVVQLRMRAAGQNQVSGHQIVAYDAAGANPVVLRVLSNVAVGTSGSRILVASPGFQQLYGGPTPDFEMTNLMPQAYLAAGKVTFDPTPSALWSLAWGGAGYTGTNLGTTDNDADGNFGTPFADVLPWTGDQSLQFTGAATAMSTTNAADYALSIASPTILTNNAGVAIAIVDCVFGDGFESGDSSGWSTTVP